MTKKLSLILLLNLFIAAGLGALIYRAIRLAGQGPPLEVYRPGTPEEERLIDDIISEGAGEKVEKAYDALFRKANQNRIERLRTHPNHGIAMRAAWEDLCRTLPDKPGWARPDHRELARFKQFVERRLQLILPDWWADGLRNSDAYGRSIDCRPSVGGLHQKTGLGLTSPLNTTLEKEHDDVVVRIDNELVRVAAAVFETKPNIWPISSISAWLGPDRLYLVLYEDSAYFHTLLRIERTSGKVSWESTVIALTGAMLKGSTPRDHFVSLTANEHQVTVFGYGHGDIYIEAFDAKDGTNLFRFNTMY